MNSKKYYDGLHDPQFTHPYIDADEIRDTPVRHRYIHGGFENTLTKFCFYFPPKERYRQRFFQFLSPFVSTETESQSLTGDEDRITFSLTHGAYFVETNLGGIVNGGDDPTLMYRASASAAQYSRRLAAEMYGEHRPFGYVYGGSGGGYKTISCAECTQGVWDGAVPFVIGSPMAMPNVFTVRVHAMRILRHKLDQIKDAMEPGGSQNPYENLNEIEREALKEASLMGFPYKTWCVYDTIGDGALPVLTPAVEMIDPTYYQDFWTIPGYLGAQKGSSAQKDRILLETEISEILISEDIQKGIGDSIDASNAYGVDEAWKHQMNQAEKLPRFRLKDFPDKDPYLRGLKIHFKDGELAGQTFCVTCTEAPVLSIDNSMDPRDLPRLLKKAAVGDTVILDNSDYIALQTYHRHQVPGRDYVCWDQFRDENGEPVYPQRMILSGPAISTHGAGSIQNGKPHCRMIVLESLMDESAFPWQADWYRRLVEKENPDKTDIFRLWYMENCMHSDCEEGNGGDHQHVVSYLGALYQALLDISDWVERGIEPANSTEYTLTDGQIILPDSAKKREGIQPAIHLYANGGKKACVRVGEEVRFTAEIENPDRGGRIDEAKWDFEKTGIFRESGTLIERENNSAAACASHIFQKPGIYFPVLKIASNRTNGDSFTRIWNLDRVRVVVTEDRDCPNN